MTTRRNVYDPLPSARTRTGRRRRVRGLVNNLAAVLDPADLYELMLRMRARNGQAPGIDGVRYDDLSRTELYELFRRRIVQIRVRKYRPQPPRKVRLAKAGGGTRELRLAVVIDRVFERAVADAINPIAEGVFLDCSSGFRKKRNRFWLLATLKVVCETFGYWVVTADDIRKAFDNVPIAAAMRALRRLNIDPALAALAEVFLRGHEQHRKEVGIAQGGALSPLVLNILLHDALDTTMAAARGRHVRVWFLRYADNVLVVTRTPAEGRERLEEMRRRLGQVGLSLKGDPGIPRLLSAGEHLDLLGLRLTRSGDRLRSQIPRDTWGEWETDLRAAQNKPNPTAAARSLVLGWVRAFAPTFGTHRRSDEETRNRLVNLLHRTGHHDALTRREIDGTVRHALTGWDALDVRF